MSVTTDVSKTGVIINPIITGTDLTQGQLLARDVSISALATPAAPTVTPAGTTGAATWTYKIVAKVGTGSTMRVTLASAGGSTAAGNATLSSTNYNAITWTAVTGATSYDIYRTAVGTSPATTGVIANVLATAPLLYNDTGAAGDSSVVPVGNTTGGVTAPGLATLGSVVATTVASITATATLTQNVATTIGFLPVVAGAIYRLYVTLPGAVAGNIGIVDVSCGTGAATCHVDVSTFVGSVTAVTVANNGTIQVTQTAATQTGVLTGLRIQ